MMATSNIQEVLGSRKQKCWREAEDECDVQTHVQSTQADWRFEGVHGRGHMFPEVFEDTKMRQQQRFQQAGIEKEKKSYNVPSKFLHSESTARERLVGFDVSNFALGQLQIIKLHDMVDKVQNLQIFSCCGMR
jgi:hypothetical protein